jgi:hypothetical protein
VNPVADAYKAGLKAGLLSAVSAIDAQRQKWLTPTDEVNPMAVLLNAIADGLREAAEQSDAMVDESGVFDK